MSKKKQHSGRDFAADFSVVYGATDPVDIAQFQAIVDRAYMQDHPTALRQSERPLQPHRDAYILLRDNHTRNIVGGVCLTTVEKHSESKLPYQERQEFNSWSRLLPRNQLVQYTRSQISSLVMEAPDAISNEAMADYLHSQKARLIKEAINYAFTTQKADVCITLPKTPSQKEMRDPCENYNCVQAATRDMRGKKKGSPQAVGILDDVYLLSTGSNKQPIQRTMFAISNNQDLSYWLKAAGGPIPTPILEPPEITYDGVTRGTKLDVSWATRIYPQGEGTTRKGPDAVIFDWDMVFSNYVPRYVAASNAAIAHIKDKYGIEPIVPHIAVTDVRLDTMEFINKLYVGNDTIKGAMNADGKVVPVLAGKAGNTRSIDNQAAQVLVAQEAHEVMMQHLAEHGLEHTTEIKGWQKTLRLLKEKKIPCAVVSNGDAAFIRQYIGTLSKRDQALLKDIPIFGDAKKPDPAKIHEACAALGVSPSEHVWFVGDTMHTDVEVAMRAGVHPILFGFRDVHEIDDLRSSKDYGHDIPKDKEGGYFVDCVPDHTSLGWRIAPERFRELFPSDEAYRRFKDREDDFFTERRHNRPSLGK